MQIPLASRSTANEQPPEDGINSREHTHASAKGVEFIVESEELACGNGSIWRVRLSGC